MKLPCYLVRDLLPLYQDEVCEPETAAALREHLDNCPDCRALWEKMQTADPLEGEAVQARRQEEAAALRRVKRSQHRKRVLIVLSAVLATLCAVCLGLRLVYEYANETYLDYDARVIGEVSFEARAGEENLPLSGTGLYATVSAEAAHALVSSKLVETEEGTAVVFTLGCTLKNQWLYDWLEGTASPQSAELAICTAGGYGRTTAETLCAAYYLPYHAFMSWFYQHDAPVPEEAVLVWQRSYE